MSHVQVSSVSCTTRLQTRLAIKGYIRDSAKECAGSLPESPDLQLCGNFFSPRRKSVGAWK
jgi:hypothetical protein